MLSPGSSPRMRGTRPIATVRDTRPGIIPAYAGNTYGIAESVTGGWDHPRVCGEHVGPPLAISVPEGSSPRMRGTHIIAVNGTATYGIIPAYAGNTQIRPIRGTCLGDHPRVCGEHSQVRYHRIADGGSSPRMRGTRFVSE